MQRLKIGQMAKLNNISEQTLRLYDKMELLSPYAKDSENAYRYYDIKQSAKLDMIQHMKSLGMGLKEIKRHLDSGDVSLIVDVLNKKSAQIDFQIEELSYQKKAIERMIESFERYESAPPDGTVVLEYIWKRNIYCIDSKINFYNYDIDTYEKILRKLKDNLKADNLPEIYFYNAGTILRKNHLLKRQFVSSEVFVMVDKEFVGRESVQTINANTYLCIYCDRFEKEKEYANRLLDEIEEKGYQICGDFLCEVIFEPPMSNGNERGMYLRLQVPIKLR